MCVIIPFSVVRPVPVPVSVPVGLPGLLVSVFIRSTDSAEYSIDKCFSRDL